MTPRILDDETLWAGHVRLQRLTIALGPDGGGALVREVVVAPTSAAILLRRHDGRLIFTRQFRAPVLLNGDDDGSLIECCAGNVGSGPAGSPPGLAEAEQAARREAEEETGWRVGAIRHLFTLYASPGVSTERLCLFVGEAVEQVGPGGGLADEGEDIKTLELTLAEAWAMAGEGRIRDMKTVLLLQHLLLETAPPADAERVGRGSAVPPPHHMPTADGRQGVG